MCSLLKSRRMHMENLYIYKTLLLRRLRLKFQPFHIWKEMRMKTWEEKRRVGQGYNTCVTTFVHGRHQ